MFLKGEQRKWFCLFVLFERYWTPGNDAVNTVDMTTKDSDHCVHSAAGLERIDSRFERRSAEGKMLSINMHATERSFVKGEVNHCSKLHCCLVLGNFHGHPDLQ